MPAEFSQRFTALRLDFCCELNLVVVKYTLIFFLRLHHHASQSRTAAPQRRADFKVWWSRSWAELITGVKGRGLQWIFDFLFFIFLKMLSFVKYPYIAAPSCHLYSDLSSPPYCLWVSDSSSLPVTARRLDFELALFTPSSVVVVVVVALRQTSRCNGKPRLSLNRRLQRSLVMFFSESVLEGRFCRLSARTGEKIWVDLLTHICLF